MGSPNDREVNGDGAIILVEGVTTLQGEQESCSQGKGWQVMWYSEREASEMRNAETALNIIRERGKRGLPLEKLYRQLYNPDLYLRAYARLYSNKGAMTPGSTPETVDAMALGKIRQLIEDIRHERYRWTPARRTYIPKKNGKKRPLGITAWTDKLLQEVIRMLLEAYYEPQMSELSHGFRPKRGCQTTLSTIVRKWGGTKWFIEGDISQCFDRIDHSTLIATLSEKVHDNRFLRLIQNLLHAGYLEDWRYNATLSGTPQGGPLSPLLANIYLSKLDNYVEQVLIPKYTKGDKRRKNSAYNALVLQAARRRKQGNIEEAKLLRRQAQQLPSQDPKDPTFRRLNYVRYADDILLGYIGTKEEAEEIKQQLSDFLQGKLLLELFPAKTLITHASSEVARFLGYELSSQQANDKYDRQRRRCINGRTGLWVPRNVIEEKCALYQKGGKPTYRQALLTDDEYTIISRYQSEYRGLVQYYLLATNVCELGKLHWVMQTSLLKTLAAKHRASVTAMAHKYQATIETQHGTMKCLETSVEREGKKPLVARFGGIPLRRRKTAVLVDRYPIYIRSERNELIKRVLADTCEICGSKQNVEVHHIRKLADLNKKGRKEKPTWVYIMAARRRKTLVTCRDCHHAIHAGKPLEKRNTSLESRVRENV